MNIVKRFKSLPISTKRLLSIGVILALLVALPLFIWAIVTQRFLFGPRASSGEPVVPTNNAISWNTPYVNLSASNFYITVNNNVFVSNDAVTIHSDPGSDNYTTLEVNWTENNTPMALYIYFNKDANGIWNVTEMRTDDGNTPPNWVYYDGFAGLTDSNTLNIPSITYTSKEGSGHIHFENLSLRPFVPLGLAPSQYGFILEPKPITPISMIYYAQNPTQYGYGVNAVLRDADFNVITNQTAYEYQWTTSNSNVVTVAADAAGDSNTCFYGISTPCPLTHANFTATGVGNATVTVNVIRKSDNVTVATANFIVTTVPSAAATPTPRPTAHGDAAECQMCGGIAGISCLPNLTCQYSRPTYPDQAGICVKPTGSNCSTSTPTPTPTGTPPPTVRPFHILFKFEGVTGNGASYEQLGKYAQVVVKFLSPNLQFDQGYVTPGLSVFYEGNGVYALNFGVFSVNLPAGDNYSLTLKGEKHVSTKFCQSTGQTLHCSGSGKISIPANPSEAVNLDFTGIPLQPGDVFPQDGQADINDFNKVVSLLAKPCSQLDAQDKLIGDLDYNGCVTVKDVFLIRQTLQTRYDEN